MVDFRKLRQRRRHGEAAKAHDKIPDGLGIGVLEERDSMGQLFIYFQRQPARYVVLGQYAEPRWDGNDIYLADWSGNASWADARTQYFDNIIMAVAAIHEIKEAFEASQRKDT